MLEECRDGVSARIVEADGRDCSVSMLRRTVIKAISQCDVIGVSLVEAVNWQKDPAASRVLKSPHHQVIIGISGRKRPGNRAWLWSNRELDALQNARIAGCKAHIADERRNAWRVSVDSYRGVACLIRTRDGGEYHEHRGDDNEGRG